MKIEEVRIQPSEGQFTAVWIYNGGMLVRYI